MEQVLVALEHTLDKNEETRMTAERQLIAAAALPGFLTLLLQIVATRPGSSAVTQAAAIALKNAIRKNWVPPDDDHVGAPGSIVIPPSDRDTIRSNILEAISLSALPRGAADQRPGEASVLRVLAECVGLIAEHDFPETWRSLPADLLRYLQAARDRTTLGAILLALRRVMKRFEYRRSSRRKSAAAADNPRLPIDLLVQSLFPSLMSFAQKLVGDPEEDGSLLRLVAKIYHSAMRLEMPALLREQAVVELWMEVWRLALQRALPASQAGVDEIDDLALRPWWKVKKSALEITLRMFQEASSSLNDAGAVVSAEQFIDTGIAGSFLAQCVQLLNAWTVAGAPLPRRVLQLALAYCLAALEPAKTYKLLRPNLKFLVADVALKVLAFNVDDAAMWQDEPEAFAAECTTPMDDPLDPRSTACLLLIDACKLRSKDVLDGLVQHLLSVFDSQPAPPALDAALYAVGALATVLAPPPPPSSGMFEEDDVVSKATTKKKKKRGAALRAEKYASQLELLMSRYVVPHLTHPMGHVRMRAVWVIGEYAHIQWVNSVVMEQAFGGLLDRLADGELPVQAMACKSLKLVFGLDPMVSVLPSAVVKKIVVPRLPEVVQNYLRVMASLGADDIVAGLESLIDAYQDEIAPMAAEICLAITQAFTHYATQDEDDDGVYAMAAMQCLDAVTALMESVVDHPELLQRMEPCALPLIASIVNSDLDVSDYLEGALRLYAHFTYYSAVPMSNDVWGFVGKLAELFHGYAFDYLEEMASPIEHLALREPERFFARGDANTGGKTYGEVAYAMCARVLDDVGGEDGASEKDLRAALELLRGMLQASPRPSTFASSMPDIFRMVAQWLSQTHVTLSPSTRTRAMELLEACLFHAPQTVADMLRGANLVELLAQIKPTLSSHRGARRRQAAAFGLLSLVGASGVPAKEKAEAIGMAAELVMLAEDDEDDENEEADMADEGDDDDDDDDDGEYDPDEDAANEDDEAYLAFLKAQNETGGAYWDDDDDGDVDVAEPDDYPWPFEGLEAKTSLRQALEMAVKASDGAEVSMYLQNLPDTQRHALIELNKP